MTKWIVGANRPAGGLDMNRRHLLSSAAAALVAPVWGLASGLAPSAAQAGFALSRARPGGAGWPSQADWEGLGRAVGGALVQPHALLAACSGASGDPACRDAMKHLGNPFYIGDQPGGTQVSGWFQAWTPQPSAYAVAARNAADVVAAVNFARAHNLRLVVKGGGHSYQGTSNAPDSLLVWTRAMHAVTLHDGFVGQGCAATHKPVPAVTVEAGAMWIDAYDAVTTKAGRYVQGGGCTTVGVAGLVQSGGFGSFSKRFGTAAGGLLEAEIVTADGVLRTVNACQGPDLYWAIKGGGGGSFGVVTKLTLMTHDLPDQFGGVDGVIKASSDASFRKLIGRFVDFYADDLCNPHWGESVQIRPDNSLHLSMVCQGLDTHAANQVWKPFFDWVAASPDEFRFTEPAGAGAGPGRGWWDAEGRRRRGSDAMKPDDRPDAPPSHAWWSGDQDQVGAFLHGYDSLWLPVSNLRPAGRVGLADRLVAASRHLAAQLHFNKGLAGAPPEAIERSRDTATNPAVLDAFALAIIATGGITRYPGFPRLPGDDAVAARNAGKVAAATDELRPLAPAQGSYVSESNFFNPSWSRAFWGEHYPRLASIKRKYDPGGLFVVHHGVGSESWSDDGFTRTG